MIKPLKYRIIFSLKLWSITIKIYKIYKVKAKIFKYKLLFEIEARSTAGVNGGGGVGKRDRVNGGWVNGGRVNGDRIYIYIYDRRLPDRRLPYRCLLDRRLPCRRLSNRRLPDRHLPPAVNPPFTIIFEIIKG